MSDSGQKFIGRNRAPRVQIEYDLETGGAQKKVDLPFIMGVMSDLKGDYDAEAGEKAQPVGEREFREVSTANFDRYMKSVKPRVMMSVENKLGGGADNLAVNMTFGSMKDFTPGAIAKQVPELNALLEKRNQLKNLLSHMDGKPDAEDLIAELLQNESLLKSLAASSADAGEGDAEDKG